MVAFAGTVAVIWVAESTLYDADRPPNSTLVAPEKPLPVITTVVPTGPLIGVNVNPEDVEGSRAIVNSEVDCTAPPGPATLILPVVVPEATVAVICVGESTVKLDAATPANCTPLVPVKPVPVMTTRVPVFPVAGVNDVIFGPAAHATDDVTIITANATTSAATDLRVPRDTDSPLCLWIERGQPIALNHDCQNT